MRITIETSDREPPQVSSGSGTVSPGYENQQIHDGGSGFMSPDASEVSRSDLMDVGGPPEWLVAAVEEHRQATSAEFGIASSQSAAESAVDAGSGPAIA